MALMTVERTGGDYLFTATDFGGNALNLDIPVEQGGTEIGFRPMQALLASLGGCSGIDIVSILKKQRQEFTGLKISIDGVREPGKEPSLWQQIDLRFDLTGPVDPAKAYRAVELSMNKYCSVAETLRRAGAELIWIVAVNNEIVDL